MNSTGSALVVIRTSSKFLSPGKNELLLKWKLPTCPAMYIVHSISIKLEGFNVRLLSEWTQRILSVTILLNRRLNSNITIIPQPSQSQAGLPDVCNWFSVHGLAIEVAHNAWWSACGQFSTTGADLIFVCTISVLVFIGKILFVRLIVWVSQRTNSLRKMLLRTEIDKNLVSH